MHSGNGSHGMIFIEFKENILDIRNSCLSAVKLKRNILNKIMMAMPADESMIIDH